MNTSANSLAAAPAADFSSANPHALASILEASQTRHIIAARDIFDIAGTKLWARDLPVSQALQRKLLDRKLREPLETCLMADDGVTAESLLEVAQAVFRLDSPLACLLKPHADALSAEISKLPIHPVAQLLLSTTQSARPAAFLHAVQAMCLNGALILAQGARPAELRTALLCGLLHDLGEMYIAPAYGEAEADRTLDVISYQQLVVHPHVGRLLITQLTDYPAVVARAIGEHHERLDGSGYPHCLQGDEASAHGRLLAVTETTLAALADGTAPLSRASIALRVIPGEYDLHWMGLISNIAGAQPSAVALQPAEALRLRLTALDTAMRAAQAATESLTSEAATPSLKQALALTDYLLTRLHSGLVTSGLWSFADVTPQDAAEVEAIEGELRFRLRRIERAVRLRAGTLTDEDTARLDRLCRLLDIGR